MNCSKKSNAHAETRTAYCEKHEVLSAMRLSPILIGGGGGQNGPLRVFAKYLKIGFARSSPNFMTFKTIIQVIFQNKKSGDKSFIVGMVTN